MDHVLQGSALTRTMREDEQVMLRVLYTFAALALGLALYGITFATQFWRTLPIMDTWEVIPLIQHWDSGSLSMSELFAQHNEHRVPLTRLAFLLDFGLFKGRLTFVYPLLIFAHLGLGVALGYVASRGLPVAHRVLAMSVGAALLVAPIQLDNLVSPYHIGWTMCGLFSLGCFVCIAELATEPRNHRAPILIGLAAVFMVLAVYSSGNGLGVAPIVLVAVMILPVGNVARFTLSAVGIFITASYLIGYSTPIWNAGLYADLGSVPGVQQFLLGIVANLGLIAQPLGVWTSAILGTVGLILWLLLALMVLSGVRSELALEVNATALLMLALMVLASTTMTSLGRAQAGVGAMMASRYGTGSVLFWACLMGAAWRMSIAVHQRWSKLLVACLSFVIVAGSYFPIPSAIGHIRWRAEAASTITQQLRAGKIDQEQIIRIYPLGADVLRDRIDFIRERKLSIFAD
jgi:hypothetical protein